MRLIASLTQPPALTRDAQTPPLKLPCKSADTHRPVLVGEIVDVEIQRFGKKTEIIHSCEQTTHPIIGYVVEDPQGWMALPTKTTTPPIKCDGRHDAIDYVRRSQ